MKYQYKYCVYYNNMCMGIQFIKAFETLSRALMYKHDIEMSGRGCCDVVKKRFLQGDNKPLYNYSYDNYKYSEYDL